MVMQNSFPQTEPYLDWAFCQPKKTGKGGGGEAKWPRPNLAISSQMTMKLGEDIEGFRGFWLNILKTVQQIFTKLLSLLDNHNEKIGDRSFIVAMVTNS